MAEEVILLGLWSSPFAMRVRVALAEKGIEYEYREEELFKNKSPLLLEMNPVYKKIPVLIHNGKPVCESFIILKYIDEVWTHQPLFPSHPYQLAQLRLLADIAENKIFTAGRGVWMAKGDAHATALKELIEGLKWLEGELGDNAYFGGDKFGGLDVVIIPIFSWFHALEVYGRLSLVEECPKVVDWANKCLLRDSVAKSLPDQLKVYAFSLELKKQMDAQQDAIN